jgi:hypothetical protein
MLLFASLTGALFSALFAPLCRALLSCVRMRLHMHPPPGETVEQPTTDPSAQSMTSKAEETAQQAGHKMGEMGQQSMHSAQEGAKVVQDKAKEMGTSVGGTSKQLNSRRTSKCNWRWMANSSRLTCALDALSMVWPLCFSLARGLSGIERGPLKEKSASANAVTRTCPSLRLVLAVGHLLPSSFCLFFFLTPPRKGASRRRSHVSRVSRLSLLSFLPPSPPRPELEHSPSWIACSPKALWLHLLVFVILSVFALTSDSFPSQSVVRF